MKDNDKSNGRRLNIPLAISQPSNGVKKLKADNQLLLRQIEKRKSEHHSPLNILQNYRKNRENKEVSRLYKLIANQRDEKIVKEIKNQISLCKALTWKDYKSFCRKY